MIKIDLQPRPSEVCQQLRERIGAKRWDCWLFWSDVEVTDEFFRDTLLRVIWPEIKAGAEELFGLKVRLRIVEPVQAKLR